MGWFDRLTNKTMNLAGDVSGGVYHGTGNLVDNITGENQANASREAAKIQAASGQKAIDFQRETRDANQKLIQPYLDSGMSDYNSLRNMQNAGQFDDPGFQYKSGPEFSAPTPGYKDPGFSLNDVMNDPGYKFRLNQGINAVQNSAAARGMLHGGNTLTGINDYAQNFASAEGDKAYSRYATDRSAGMTQNNFDYGRAQDQYNANRNFNYGSQYDQYNSAAKAREARFNRLSDLAGYGQKAASALAGVNSDYGTNAGNIQMGIGNAQAAGNVGAANAFTQGTQNLGNIGGFILGRRSK